MKHQKIEISLDIVRDYNPTVAIIAGIMVNNGGHVTMDTLTALTGLSRQLLSREINLYLYIKDKRFIFTKHRKYDEEKDKLIYIYGLTEWTFIDLKSTKGVKDERR